MFFCQTVFLSVYLSFCLPIFVSIHFSVYPFFCLSISGLYFCICLSIFCLYFCLSICLPNYLFDSISAVSILRSIPIYIYVIYQSISSGGTGVSNQINAVPPPIASSGSREKLFARQRSRGRAKNNFRGGS